MNERSFLLLAGLLICFQTSLEAIAQPESAFEHAFPVVKQLQSSAEKLIDEQKRRVRMQEAQNEINRLTSRITECERREGANSLDLIEFLSFRSTYYGYLKNWRSAANDEKRIAQIRKDSGREFSSDLSSAAGYFRQGHYYPEAVDCYEQILSYYKNDASKMKLKDSFNLGRCYVLTKRYDKAESFLTKFLATRDADRVPHDDYLESWHKPQALALLAKAQLGRREFAKAIANYERAMKIWKESHQTNCVYCVNALPDYAEALRATGREKDAAAALEQAAAARKVAPEVEPYW